MDTDEIKEKLRINFSWDSILQYLPGVLVVGGILLVLDKVVGISGKLSPLYKKVKKWNRDGLFEIIDTVGDNIQLLDLILKAVGVDLKEDQLDNIADGLQNVGTVGKHVSTLWRLIAPSLGLSGGGSRRSSKGQKYLEE